MKTVLRRQGSVVRVIEFRCPRCSRRLICTLAEATPPRPGLVATCGDCRKGGYRVELLGRKYRSGPSDLIV